MKKIASPKLTIPLSILLILQLSITAFAGVSFIPGQGVVLTGADGVVLTGADGVVLTGADGVVLTGADGVVLTGADGVVLTGADGVVLTGADGVVLTGADAVSFMRPYGVVLTGADTSGIHSFDPELAMLMNRLPDTSFINVFITYHQMPTESDLNALRAVGILGGTRFRNLPIIQVNATRKQIAAVSKGQTVRSIYLNKSLDLLTNDARILTGQANVLTDRSLTQRNGGLPVLGQGVKVAVLDTGIDATHPDLSSDSHVVQNVRVLDQQSLPVGFLYPQVSGNLPNTDLTMGHGTFVAGVIAGTGTASGGYYGGIAPGAQLIGVSCGDASLFFVLSGIDYLLSNYQQQNIRVVNCSFGINGVFDANEPVNVATRIMHDAGISVVFSAGNRGGQPGSLNPYSVAPWVIGVGATTKGGSLASFSSRGQAGYAIFHPTLVAPGEGIVSARAQNINLVSTVGLSGLDVSGHGDLERIAPTNLARYTSSSGTSFAAPQVAGTIALMLQANPELTPDQIKDILQETATPMLGYSRYEVGAGHLNTYAAVRKAAFGTPFGLFRGGIGSAGIKLVREAVGQFSGAVAPGASQTFSLSVPEDVVYSTVQVGWLRNVGTSHDLKVTASRGERVIESVSGIRLAGEGLQKTGLTVDSPEAGEWTVTVKNTGTNTTGEVENFSGAIETFRVDYSQVSDINQVPAADLAAVKRALRTGLMTTTSGAFAGNSPATRLDVARAIMLGASTRIPQYLPYNPSFTDVAGDANAVFIESCVRSPRGNLFQATGASFNPQGQIDRLSVAVMAVKLIASDQEVQAASFSNPGIGDWDQIPGWARGYVALALARSLMRAESNQFRPQTTVSRSELASVAAGLQQNTK
jgi:serine protease AprX